MEPKGYKSTKFVFSSKFSVLLKLADKGKAMAHLVLI